LMAEVFVSGHYVYMSAWYSTGTCSSSDATGCELMVFDISGIEATSVMAHSLEAGSLQVRDNAIINNQLTVGGGLNIGNGGLFSGGSVGIGVTTASSALYVQQLGTGPAASFIGGNIGIGTSTTSSTLQIVGNSVIGFAPSASGPSSGLAVSGNVGIGITTANSTLSVAGGAHIGSLRQGIAAPTDGLFVDGNVGIGATTSNNLLDVWGATNITGNLTLGGVSLVSDGTATAPSYSFSGDTNTGIFRPGTDALGLSTGGSSRLTVTAAGLVGIGTTSPAASFQVNSGANSTVINSSGNVGIGTTSPRMPLEVVGNGTYSALFTNGNIGIGTSIANGSLIIGSGGPSGTGNVGIGLTGFAYPSFKLQVAGNIGPDQGPTIAATTQTATTIDTTGTVGQGSSVAIGPDGFPIISYGVATSSIRVTKCGNAACSSGNTSTVLASGNNYNQETSVVIGTDGLPLVGYLINTGGSGSVTIVKCGNASCSAGNTSTVVFSTEAAPGPDYVSIAIGTNGNPVVAYSRSSSTTRLISCGNASCSAGNIDTSIGSGNDRPPIKAVIGTDGFPLIPFVNASDATFHVVHCGNAGCTSGNTNTTVDSGATNGGFSGGVAIGSDGLPIISYYNNSALDLIVIHCGNISCSSGNIKTSVDTENNVGSWSSMTIGTDGLAIIAFSDDTNLDLRVFHCSNIACTTGTATSIDTANNVGTNSSIAIGTDGLPFISFYDSSSGDARVIKCATVSCNATTGTALTGGSSLGNWMPNSRSFGAAFETVNTYQIANPSTFQRLSILSGGAERLSINPQGNVGIGTSAANGLLDIQKALFGAPSLTGKYLSISASTFTDQTTASSGTATNMAFNSIAQPTLAAANAPVTTTNAYSFYLAGAPVSGTNELVNNSIALGIAAGAVGTGTTASYGLYVNAQTGAASNYGAVFATGNVGIGFTSPGSNLDVFNTTSSSDVNILRVLSNVGGTGTVKFRVDSDGDVFSDGGTAMGTPADVAENYPVLDEAIEAGDLVTTSDIPSDIKNKYGELQPYIEKSKLPYQNNLIGIISTKPGVLLSANTEGKSVALAGRVPVKVSTENGLIEAGDYLTSSSTPGVAMKATRAGAVVGKALESFACQATSEESKPTSEVCQGKILVFVNVSFADPGNFFASLSLDNEGNLIIPKLKTGSIILDPFLATASAQLTEDPAYQNPGPILSSNQNSFDVGGKIVSLEDRIKSLETRVKEQDATVSAKLAEATSSAQTTSGESGPTPEVNLTPPDILLATGSATLANLKVTSEATFSGMLAAYDLNISNSFKSLGETTLGKTLIAGDLIVDGMLSITGSSLSNLSILYIQNSPLAEGLDIFNGKVTIDKEGNIQTQGKITASEVETNKLTISNTQIASSSATLAASIGTGTLPANTIKITIPSTLVTLSSKIFITPTTSTDKVLSVTNIIAGESFDVSLVSPGPDEIKFNWWIVQTE
ncbi:MAG: hypothetical protein US99_C0073G0001, partial [Candidatus Daviesbacteria bacterium GW2011_GWF2_38_6]